MYYSKYAYFKMRVSSSCVQEQTVATSAEPKLVRTVSRWQIVALAVNDVNGSGVYLLPAAAAACSAETRAPVE